MTNYGFVRVGSAVPEMKVADCSFNSEKILELMEKAVEQKAYITVFPELCITGYTCGDLFGQQMLLCAALDALDMLRKASSKWNNVFVVGLPLIIDQQLFNCGLVLQQGHILGVVPKRYIPNYNEFYEKRWFREGRDLSVDSVRLFGQDIPCGIDLIFQDKNTPEASFAIELCEDMWMAVPPSSIHALNGAVILCNLSASNEIVGKHEYREILVKSQSGRCIAAYVYASAGVGESTTDLVFGGHGIIGEYGSILGQTQRFRKDSQLLTADIDVCKLIRERVNATSFTQTDLPRKSRKIQLLEVPPQPIELNRNVDPHPFVPSDPVTRNERCHEVFTIQASGLEKRFVHTKLQKAVLGISGGLDSTLALLVTVKAFDNLGIPRENIIAITMPGFGTTNQSYQIAMELMQSMGVEIREINIKDACLQHFKDIGHDPSIHDLTYENVQARERTQILMDIANKEGGLVIGTGDLSELALGWCTYNGDHMSMYSVNCNVPKTLVKSLVKWAAEHILDKETAELLYRVVEMPISPELLPPSSTGEIEQKTEDLVGPYELHDFFLYHMIRYGAEPQKIKYLAQKAFNGQYDEETIKKWLKVFYRRFFSQQFKRSCLPDGPKVGTISLSPRGDWRMPSDASARVWLEELE
ncbi:MAG: NAD(+) synthase [Thermoclostridium sp.]|nr:NAD(+) synthase [Thermoclostridium sp.]